MMLGVTRTPASYWAERLDLQVYAPLPRDRAFWAVTFENGALELRYSDDHQYYASEDVWRRIDGEPGIWEAADIAGWCDSQYDAAEAELLLGAA